jgi:hypothetical protein
VPPHKTPCTTWAMLTRSSRDVLGVMGTVVLSPLVTWLSTNQAKSHTTDRERPANIPNGRMGEGAGAHRTFRVAPTLPLNNQPLTHTHSPAQVGWVKAGWER